VIARTIAGVVMPWGGALPSAPVRAAVYEYSASQLETFSACARKWAFEKIDLLPKKSTRAAAFGTGVHTQIERKQTGLEFDFSEVRNGWGFSPADCAKIAQSALPYIPAFGTPNLIVEGEFSGVDLSTYAIAHLTHMRPDEVAADRGARPFPWTYKGRIDWRIYTPSRLDVGDHKTTRDEKWIKTADDLRTDTQAAIYSAIAFHRNPALDEVNLQWTYMLTEGARRAKVVLATVSRAANAAVMLRVDGIAAQATDMRRHLKQATEYPPNYNACDDYGGCPYRSLGKCNPTFDERIDSIMANSPQQPPPFMPNFGAPMTQPQQPPFTGAFAPPGQQPPPAWPGAQQTAPQAPPQWPQQTAPQAPPAPSAAAAPGSDADLRERALAYRDQYGRLTKVPAGPCEGMMLPPALVVGDVWIPSPHPGAASNASVRLEPLQAIMLPYLEHCARGWAEYMTKQPQQAFEAMQVLNLPPQQAQQQPQTAQQPQTFAQQPQTAPQPPSQPAWPVPGINAPEGANSPIPTGAAVEELKGKKAKKGAAAPAAAQTPQPPPAFGSPAPQPAQETAPANALTLYVDCAPSSADFVEAHHVFAAARRQAGAFPDNVESMVRGQLATADVALALDTSATETAQVLTRLSSLASEIIRARR